MCDPVEPRALYVTDGASFRFPTGDETPDWWVFAVVGAEIYTASATLESVGAMCGRAGLLADERVRAQLGRLRWERSGGCPPPREVEADVRAWAAA